MYPPESFPICGVTLPHQSRTHHDKNSGYNPTKRVVVDRCSFPVHNYSLCGPPLPPLTKVSRSETVLGTQVKPQNGKCSHTSVNSGSRKDRQCLTGSTGPVPGTGRTEVCPVPTSSSTYHGSTRFVNKQGAKVRKTGVFIDSLRRRTERSLSL